MKIQINGTHLFINDFARESDYIPVPEGYSIIVGLTKKIKLSRPSIPGA